MQARIDVMKCRQPLADRLFLTASLMIIGGCSVGGTWRTVKVEPEPAGGYPVSLITFDENSMTYAANRREEAQFTTSEGTYDWDGFTLTLTPKDGVARVYKGYLLWGKLKLRQSMSGTNYVATLVRDEVADD